MSYSLCDSLDVMKIKEAAFDPFEGFTNKLSIARIVLDEENLKKEIAKQVLPLCRARDRADVELFFLIF